MKKLLLLVFCFTIFFTLPGRCEAFFASDEILQQIAKINQQNQLALSDIVKKATSDKTTISSAPVKIENLSTPPKTLIVKQILGTRQWKPENAITVQCLRATDFTMVFCPCHYNILELRL